MRPTNYYQDNLVIISKNSYTEHSEDQTRGDSMYKAPPTAARKSISSASDAWSPFELKIKYNLELNEKSRKFCAYCGQHESNGLDESCGASEKMNVLLGRCYGCQMVFYCSQEHQHLDWIENHMPKCAELEWASLCELIDSMPLDLLWFILTDLVSFRSSSSSSNLSFQTWTEWFEMRPSILETITELAQDLYREHFAQFSHNFFLNRREPSLTDLIDGMLARVTDTMTYALTIADTMKRLQINPDSKPICIHLIYPPEELVEDLINFYEQAAASPGDSIHQGSSNRLDQLYELVNIFPANHGFELVFIADISHYDNLGHLLEATSPPTRINWTKTTYLRRNLTRVYNFFLTFWQGNYSDYIKYSNQVPEYYTKPDLVVSFHPSFTRSPHQKLITDWTDDLRVILANNLTCLFTFDDKDEKERAFSLLGAFHTNFIHMGSNQFSSLLLRQVDNKPNETYSKNAFSMCVRGLCANLASPDWISSIMAPNLNGYFINFRPRSNESTTNHHQQRNHPSSSIGSDELRRSKSIHDLGNNHQLTKSFLFQQQTKQIRTDACIQTMGLDDPENSSLRHINGKLKITKPNNLQSIYDSIVVQSATSHQQSQFNRSIYKSSESLNSFKIYKSLDLTTCNRNNLVDICIDNDQQSSKYTRSNHSQKPPPLLDYSATSSHSILNESQSQSSQVFRPTNFITKQSSTEPVSTARTSQPSNTTNLVIQTNPSMLVNTNPVGVESHHSASSQSSSSNWSGGSGGSRLKVSPKNEALNTRRFYQPRQLVIPPTTMARSSETISRTTTYEKLASTTSTESMIVSQQVEQKTMPVEPPVQPPVRPSRKSSFSTAIYSSEMTLADDETLKPSHHEAISSSSTSSTSSSMSEKHPSEVYSFKSSNLLPSTKPRLSNQKEETYFSEDFYERTALNIPRLNADTQNEFNAPIVKPRINVIDDQINETLHSRDSETDNSRRLTVASRQTPTKPRNYSKSVETNPLPKPRNSSHDLLCNDNYDDVCKAYNGKSSANQFLISDIEDDDDDDVSTDDSHSHSQAITTATTTSSCVSTQSCHKNSSSSSIDKYAREFKQRAVSRPILPLPETNKSSQSGTTSKDNKVKEYQIESFSSSSLTHSAASSSNSIEMTNDKKESKLSTAPAMDELSSSSGIVNHMKNIFELTAYKNKIESDANKTNSIKSDSSDSSSVHSGSQKSDNSTRKTISPAVSSLLNSNDIQVLKSPLKKFNIENNESVTMNKPVEAQPNKIEAKIDSSNTSGFKSTKNEEMESGNRRETNLDAAVGRKENVLANKTSLPSFQPAPPPPPPPPPVPVSVPPSLTPNPQIQTNISKPVVPKAILPLSSTTTNENLVSKILANTSSKAFMNNHQHQQLQKAPKIPINNIPVQNNRNNQSNLPPRPVTVTLTSTTTTTTTTVTTAELPTTTATPSLPFSTTNSDRPGSKLRLVSNSSSTATQAIGSLTTRLPPSTSNTKLNEFRLISTHSAGTTNNNNSNNTLSDRSSLNMSIQTANANSKCVISHLADSVDEVKLEMSGERRIFVPGYMTSADILRNILLKKSEEAKQPVEECKQAAAKPVESMSLKEKLLMKQRELQHKLIEEQMAGGHQEKMNQSQFFNDAAVMYYNRMANNQKSYRPIIPYAVQHNQQPQRHQPQQQHHQDYYSRSLNMEFSSINSIMNQNAEPIQTLVKSNLEDDEELAKKFTGPATRTRTRSLSGMISIQPNNIGPQVIDIDLDYEYSTPKNIQHQKNPVESVKGATDSPKTVKTPVYQQKPPLSATAQQPQAQYNQVKKPDIIKLPDHIKEPAYSVPKLITSSPSCIEPKGQTDQIQSKEQSKPKPATTQHIDSESSSMKPNNKNVETQYATVIQTSRVKENGSVAKSSSRNSSGRPAAASSVRNSSSRRIATAGGGSYLEKKVVTGSFDPNDFDSFDERSESEYEEYECQDPIKEMPEEVEFIIAGNLNEINDQSVLQIPIESIEKIQNKPVELAKTSTTKDSVIPIEPLEKIRSEATIPEGKIEEEMNVVHFDPTDFDSFDEEEEDTMIGKSYSYKRRQIQQKLDPKSSSEPVSQQRTEKPVRQRQQHPQVPVEAKQVVEKSSSNPTPVESPSKSFQFKSSSDKNSESSGSGTSNFFRSALDRLSMKSAKRSDRRSSSVPLRTLIKDMETGIDKSAQNNVHCDKAVDSPKPKYEARVTRTPQGASELRETVERSKSQAQISSDQVMTKPAPNNNESPHKTSGVGFIANMKTLHLMSKIQSEHDEKQKRKKLRKQQIQQQLQQQKQAETTATPVTPRTERKLLNSIINTLFSPQSSSNNEEETDSANKFEKNEKKRLSLKKLKMKDKTKKSGRDTSGGDMISQSQTSLAGSTGGYEFNYQSDTDNEHHMESRIKSSQSLNLITCNENGVTSTTARFGKIKQEDRAQTSLLSNNNKENLMRQLQAELDEEIKERKLIESKEMKLNSINKEYGILTIESQPAESIEPEVRMRSRKTTQQTMNQVPVKARSKSVTFLDEFEDQEANEEYEEEELIQDCPPKRGIMKKQEIQSQIIDYDERDVPRANTISRHSPNIGDNQKSPKVPTANRTKLSINKSQTTPNLAKYSDNNDQYNYHYNHNHVVQSDL